MVLLHSGRYRFTCRKSVAGSQWNRELRAMGSAEPDYRRRAKLLWDCMARFKFAMRPPDKFDDTVTEYCGFAFLGEESSSHGTKLKAALAASETHSSKFNCSAAFQLSCKSLASRGTDLLSSEPPTRPMRVPCRGRPTRDPLRNGKAPGAVLIKLGRDQR